MKKTIIAAGVIAAMLAGTGPAFASQAHPKPSSSCSRPGTTAVYYTPKTHHRDILRCERVHKGSHYRDLWKIIGH
jgi:hypothetical protein